LLPLPLERESPRTLELCNRLSRGTQLLLELSELIVK
jgi:hypothetical protein